jgi:hypothetical protein
MESQDKDLNAELNNDLEAGPPSHAAPEEPQLEEVMAEGREAPSYSPPPPSKSSRTRLIIGLAVGVLLCVVCVVAVILARPYLPFLGTKLAAPKLMPADTAFIISINVDIGDVAGFKHLAEVYGDIPDIEDGLDDFLEQMEDELDISYQDDIKPWLGPEVTMAVFDMESVFEGEEPAVVMSVVTRDTKASDAFLGRVLDALEDQGYDVEEETYQGIDYYAAWPENDWDTSLFFGTVNKSVILAVDQDAFEDIIDVSKGDSDSLAENKRYSKLMDALPGDAVAHMFFDMEAWTQTFLQDLKQGGVYSELELPEEAFEQLETLEAFQAFGLALSLDKEGIQFDFAMTFDADALSPEALENLQAKASANRILKRIPGDAVGFFSGQNLAAAWRNAFSGFENLPDVEEQLDDLQDELGLRIDEELLDWLSGEFAFAVVEARGVEDVPVGGFAVFEVDDREEAEGAMDEIVDALEEMADFEFVEEDIRGVEMQVIVDSYSEEIVLGYSFTDKHLVIGFTEDALEDAVDDDMRSITQDEAFKKVQGHLPSKTGGYFYLNIEEVLQLVYSNMSDYDQETFDQEYSPYLDPVKAMGIAASPIDVGKGISQGSLFIYIPGE